MAETAQTTIKEPNSNLNIYYQNVNYLRTKILDYRQAIIGTDYDVFVFIETNLNDSIQSTELFGDDFVVFRHDRQLNRTPKKEGGGILVAVRSTFSASCVTLVDNDDFYFEQLAVKVSFGGRTIYFFAVYLPHWCRSEERFQAVAHSLNNLVSMTNPDDLIIFMGDFNLTDVNWQQDNEFQESLFPINACDDLNGRLLNDIFSCGFFQINHVSNVNGKFLDLVFINDFCGIQVRETSPLYNSEIHHPALDIILPFIKESDPTVAPAPSFDFKRANLIRLNQHLRSIDWCNIFIADLDSDLFSGLVSLVSDYNWSIIQQIFFVRFMNDFSRNEIEVCDCNVYIFYIVFYDALLRFVPYTVRRPPRFPAYFSSELRSIGAQKSVAYRKFCKSRSDDNYKSFSDLRRKFKILHRKDYLNHLTDLGQGFKSDPKSFWSYINSKRGASRLPATMHFQDRSSSEPSEVCGFFSEYFKSVYSSSDFDFTPDFHLETFCHQNLSTLHFTDKDVFEALTSLNPSKGAGPDGVSPGILKSCAAALTSPLGFLFNESMRCGYFPRFWRLSMVAPIFKSGRRDDVLNYRGVAKETAPAKLLESMVNLRVSSHVENAIAEQQHGFVSGRSCLTNLVSLSTNVTSLLEQNGVKQVDIVYTDFRKAFDRVPIKCLLKTLPSFGVVGELAVWMSSYLYGRMQYVQVEHEKSSIFLVPSGVPQGSHLGPTLFICFINFVLCYILRLGVGFLLYADDFKMFLSISSASDCQRFQLALDAFDSFCRDFGMELNLKKCKTMSFSRSRNPIVYDYRLSSQVLERVFKFTDLGVIFNSRFDFNDHIGFVVSKSRSMMGFVKRQASEFSDSSVLMSLYFSFVRSGLEYCAVVWSPYYLKYDHQVERTQKKFVRFALRNIRPDFLSQLDYTGKCAYLGIESLKLRRVMASLKFVFDVFSNRLKVPSILSKFMFNCSRFSLRCRRFFFVPKHRTNYGFNEPLSAMLRYANQLPELFDFRLESRDAFVSRLKDCVKDIL